MSELQAAVAPVGLSDLPLRAWRPISELRKRETSVDRPHVRAVDAHNHLGRWLADDGGWLIRDVGALLADMDAVDIDAVVNLDGRWGADLDANVARYDSAHPGRFATFCHLDWKRFRESGDITATLCADLERAAGQGARGLKVWKDLGLSVRDSTGELVLPDDPRLSDVFATAGVLGLPVLIHTADPIAFFAPFDERNERVDELLEMPSWWFGGPGLPSFDRLIDALATVVRSCPGTTFIGAHVGCVAEDLDRVDALMTQCPNFHIDLGGRLAEIGRQPRRFAELVAAHPDRVLFGTDCFPLDIEIARTYYRFLETADESFSYAPGADIPPQGRWHISAAALDPSYLPAIYRENALRLIRFH